MRTGENPSRCRKFRRRVRNRMKETGESYTAARRNLTEEAELHKNFGQQEREDQEDEIQDKDISPT